jgi:hypothetical protein
MSMELRHGAPKGNIILVQNNLANTYRALGQLDRALRLRRAVYDDAVAALGPDHDLTLNVALGLSVNLAQARSFREARSLSSKVIPIARQKLGAEHDITLQLRALHAGTLFQPDGATRSQVLEAVTMLEGLVRVVRRVFGDSHPHARTFQAPLDDAKAKLAKLDA